jgi:hypothetical protein
VTGIQVRSLPAYFRRLPSLDESSAYLAGWLAGYVAADGHVREAEVQLCSHSREHLEFAALVAARLGIACREPVVQKNPHNAWAPDSETWSLAFVSATVPDWLLLRADQHEAWAEPRHGRSPSWMVESVTATGLDEEVFCATVDGYGAFTLDGWLLTGNSWGLAVDINSLANPYQFPRRTDQPTWMPLLWNRYGFAWGGNYNDNGRLGKADSMHYEFMGTPADADQMTALALYELTGEYVPVGGSGSSRKDDPVAVIPITVAADNTFRSAVMAEAGGDSIVVARALDHPRLDVGQHVVHGQRARRRRPRAPAAALRRAEQQHPRGRAAGREQARHGGRSHRPEGDPRRGAGEPEPLIAANGT